MKNLSKHISLNLKKLREEHGWSLDKAAKETGVSKAMLGQIERQESSPTIATLWKIASGFNTSFSSFIEETQTDSTQPVYRPGISKDIHPADKMRVAPLFPFDKETKSEIFIIELLPSYEHLSPPHQSGVIEHVIVIEGTMDVLINNEWRTLKKGEGLRFNANQPHGYRNKTKAVTCFHNIVHYL